LTGFFFALAMDVTGVLPTAKYYTGCPAARTDTALHVNNFAWFHDLETTEPRETLSRTSCTCEPHGDIVTAGL
jgi:hypothetical protein